MAIADIVLRVVLGTIVLFIAFALMIGIGAPRTFGWYWHPNKKRYVFNAALINPISVLIALALAGSVALAFHQILVGPGFFR